MTGLKDRKWAYVLISILLAVFLWLYVRAEEDPTIESIYRGVEVQVIGNSVLASKGLTISDLSTDEVNVTIQAPASVQANLNRKNITVTLDVSRIETEGSHTLAYTINLPTNINTEGAVAQARDPESISVSVGKLYASTLPIQFQHKGSIAKGYQAGTPTISPENVTISGAVDQVSQVASVVAVLEAKDLSERFVGDLPLTLLDAHGKQLTELDVDLNTQSAYVVYPVVVTKEIPLKINYISGGGATEDDISALIIPKTITVSGAKEDMENLTEIYLGSIDLSKVTGNSTLTFPITLDPSLENVTGTTEATVNITVNNLSSKTFDVSNIKLQNVPEGFSCSAATASKTITVRGDKAALEAVDPSQIRIVADLNDVTGTGTYTVPVRVYLDASPEVGIVGSYDIVVNVSR